MSRGWTIERFGPARTLAALALLATLFRALVPAGYMLTPVAGGLIEITLCSGHGPVAAVLDLRTGDVAPHRAPDQPAHEKDAGAPCVFAATAHAAPPLAFEAVAAPVLVSAVVRLPPSRAGPPSVLAAPPPWSTGPPSLA